MTSPHVGNTGMNDEDPESRRIWVSGLRRPRPRAGPLELALGPLPRRRAARPGRRRHQRHRHPRADPPPPRARRDARRHLHHRGRPAGAAARGCCCPPRWPARSCPATSRRERRTSSRGGGPEAVHGRRPRPRHQGQHPADDERARHRGARAAGHLPPRGRARGRARRAVLLQRPRRPGGHDRAGRAAPARARARHPLLRHLLRQPALRPRAGLRHLQAEVRPPRDQPAGDGPHDRQGRGHRPQPRLRGRRPARGDHHHAVRRGERQPRLPQRRRRRGPRAPRRRGSAEELLGAVPPGGRGRTARRGLPLRPVLRPHGGRA